MVCRLCGLEASCRSFWGMQRCWLRQPTQLDRQLSLFELFMPLLLLLVWSRLKTKDKLKAREGIAWWCLSFIASCLILKQGHYTLCIRRTYRKAPNLWRAPLPSQTTKPSLGKTGNYQTGRTSLQRYSELSVFRGNPLGDTIPVTVIRKTACLLACCCIDRSSPNWRVAGACISVTFLRATSDFGTDMCDCREETGKTGDKITKPAQTVVKERWGL